MFEYYNRTLCVQASWLYEDARVISKSNYDALIRRGWLSLLRRGGNGRKALVAWESIPSRFQEQIIEEFGDPKTAASEMLFENRIQRDPNASQYFNNYTLDNGNNLPDKSIAEYIANAEILNLVHVMINETKAARGKVQNVWKSLAYSISKLPLKKYPHSLPKNHEALRRKYAVYKMEAPSQKHPRVGYESLIHAGFCNDNTRKIKGAIADWWIANYALPNKPKVPTLMPAYDVVRAQKNWPSLTIEVVTSWLHQPENERIWCIGRHGIEYYNNRFKHYIKRKKDNWFPNAYWAIDGSKLDWLHYEDVKLGMAGKLKINPVFDIFSEKIIGWSYSETENHIDHFNAVKMAVTQTGARPYLFTYDNQAGHKSERMQHLYDNIVAKTDGIHYPHKARMHNSPVESLFARLQQQIVNQLWFSDKQSVTVRTEDSRPNIDFLMQNRHKMKTKENLLRAWEMCVKLWNEAKHPKFKDRTRNEVFEMEAPSVEKFGLEDIIETFWIFNKGSRYKAGGIELQVANQEYEYEVYNSDDQIDLEFRRKYVGRKLFIKYDPDYLTDFVALYDKDASGNMVFVANAQPKRAHETVPALMQEGDKSSWRTDYDIRTIEFERDNAEMMKIRQRTGITPERLIEHQELLIKMGGDLPKEERLVLDSELVIIDPMDRM